MFRDILAHEFSRLYANALVNTNAEFDFRNQNSRCSLLWDDCNCLYCTASFEHTDGSRRPFYGRLSYYKGNNAAQKIVSVS
jgi:hypothetical protein